MAINIGPRIGIDGEKEYKNSLREIIAETKTLKSEMGLLEASFSDSTSEMDKAKQRTELLKKQQEALTKEVEKLKGAVDASSDKFGENSTEAQTWKKKLADAETELEKINQQLKDNSGWAAFGRECDAAAKKLEGIGTAFTNTGRTLTRGLTMPIIGIGTATVKTAADFESEMSKVEAISGASADEMDQLEAKAREMGEATKFSASEAGQAMEYMAMAGWKADDMLSGIEGIMNLAAASGEDLGTTSDIVTDALTAFGMSAAESTHMADVLAAASANANTNVSMMGESFKYVAPVAGSLGYTVDDIAIALGLMANSGIKASQAGTSLRTILTNMVAPSEKADGALAALGVSLEDGNGHMYTFREVMEQLRAGMGELQMPVEEFQQHVANLDQLLEDGTITEENYAEQMADLTQRAYGAEGAMKAQAAAAIGGQRGMSALLAIVNSSPEDFDKLAAAVDGSGGAAAGMAAIMQDNLNGQLTILLSKLQELAISFGEVLLPKITEIVDKIQGLVDKFNGLDEEQQKQIINIALILAALGPVLSVVGTIIKVIGVVTGIVGKISAAIAGAGGLTAAISGGLAAAAPVVGVIAAIAAAIAAVILVIKNWDKISKAITETWEKVKEGVSKAAEAVKEGVVNAWNGMKEKVTQVGENIKTGVSNAWETLKTKTSTAWESIKGTATEKWDQAKTTLLNGANAVLGFFGTDFETLKSKITKPLEDAKTAISTVWETIKGFFRSGIETIKGLFNFHIDWPHIKMPHFKISGSFSLSPPSVPKLTIDWYRKAMEGGMILNSPTIFGAQNGRLLGGGEAGPEVVVGLGSLESIIRSAVGQATYNNTYGGTTINVYGAPGQDVEELADLIEEKIAVNVYRRGAAFG